jgi:hypothetical protein
MGTDITTEEVCGFAWRQGRSEQGADDPFRRVTCILPSGHTKPIHHVCAEDRDRLPDDPRVPPMGEPLTLEWYANYENVSTLTSWMADNGYSAREVADAVQTPWSYQDEFIVARQVLTVRVPV